MLGQAAEECVDVVEPCGLTTPEVLPEAPNSDSMCKISVTLWLLTHIQWYDYLMNICVLNVHIFNGPSMCCGYGK